MAYTVTTFPLIDNPNYTFKIVLEGETYSVSILYNERMQMSFLSLMDALGNPIVSGLGLTPTTLLLVDYSIPKLTGYLKMTAKGDPNVEYYKLYPDKLFQYYSLIYFSA